VGFGFTEITVSFALLSGGACYLHKSGLAVSSSSMKRKIELFQMKIVGIIYSRSNIWDLEEC